MAIVGYYKFNGNTNDSSGNGNNGTSANATYPVGKFNNYILYSASKNGYSNIGYNYNFTSGDFTFSFLIYFLNFTPSSTVEFKLISHEAYNTFGYVLYYHATNDRIYFRTCQSGASQYSGTIKLNLELNIWYHIVLSRSGASADIYINGKKVTDYTGSHITPTGNAGYPTYINRNTIENSVIGYVAYDNYIIDNILWQPSRVKNEYSRIKGFF